MSEQDKKASPKWVISHSSGAVVRPVETCPPLEALTPKERPKIRPGEALRVGIDVICEPTSHFGKRAILPSPVASGVSFEILCDEGKAVGGAETAPSPMAYFTAGVAFCLMTHITGYLRFIPLDIRKLKLEVRGNYMTKLGHIHEGGQGEGGCDGFETYVIIESDEPPEKIAEFVALCERACIASQTLAKAIPTSVNVVLNGHTV